MLAKLRFSVVLFLLTMLGRKRGQRRWKYEIETLYLTLVCRQSTCTSSSSFVEPDLSLNLEYADDSVEGRYFQGHAMSRVE